VLAMHESFLGKENMRLTEELTAELTGILSWALDGLDRLTRQGRFTEPKFSLDSILALQDLVSPKAAFVRDCCEVGIGYDLVAGLFDAWKVWAETNGHRPGTVQTFGRDIRAVVPSLRQARPRDGEDRERRYVGIRLKSTGHDGGDRGPVWTTGQNSAHNWQNSAPVRDGPPENTPQLRSRGDHSRTNLTRGMARSPEFFGAGLLGRARVQTPQGFRLFLSPEPLVARRDDNSRRGRYRIVGVVGVIVDDDDLMLPRGQRWQKRDQAVRHGQILPLWRAENVVLGQVDLQRGCLYLGQRHVRGAVEGDGGGLPFRD
jgi:hypothetical protein